MDATVLRGLAGVIPLVPPDCLIANFWGTVEVLNFCVDRLGAVTPEALAQDEENVVALLIASFDTITAIAGQVGTTAAALILRRQMPRPLSDCLLTSIGTSCLIPVPCRGTCLPL